MLKTYFFFALFLVHLSVDLKGGHFVMQKDTIYSLESKVHGRIIIRELDSGLEISIIPTDPNIIHLGPNLIYRQRKPFIDQKISWVSRSDNSYFYVTKPASSRLPVDFLEYIYGPKGLQSIVFYSIVSTSETKGSQIFVEKSPTEEVKP